MRIFASGLGLTLLAGLAFLYLPLIVVIIYSFDASRLVTVWSGFSFAWYGALWHDAQIRKAAVVSLIVALASATLATIVGTAAGYSLARFGRFKGRTIFAGAVAAPLVLPEVITGLSMLLLFAAIDEVLPLRRGISTIVIAHASFTLTVVSVIVQARLAGLGRDLEDAAADLGARPATAFFRVTLPMITPAVIGGWLLAFVLSLDDVVIASFVSGPQSTTLPMVIYSSIRLGLSPKINALATVLVAVTAIVLALAHYCGLLKRGSVKSS